MINPETIDISVLPFVALETRQALPPVSAIYFAIDSLGAVQYIGKSTNLRSRWGCHHKHNQLDAIGGCRISWMEVDSAFSSGIELALIQWFDPPLNRSSKPKKSKPKESKSKKQLHTKRLQAMITPSLKDQIDLWSKKMGMNSSEFTRTAVEDLICELKKTFN